jgi:hypothetical protein
VGVGSVSRVTAIRSTTPARLGDRTKMNGHEWVLAAHELQPRAASCLRSPDIAPRTVQVHTRITRGALAGATSAEMAGTTWVRFPSPALASGNAKPCAAICASPNFWLFGRALGITANLGRRLLPVIAADCPVDHTPHHTRLLARRLCVTRGQPTVGEGGGQAPSLLTPISHWRVADPR